MARFYRNPRESDPYDLRSEEKPTCILLAEGPAEAWFLDAWLEVTKCDPKSIAVVCFKGRNRLDAAFKLIAMAENFPYVKRFGFLLDAETNRAGAAVDQVRQILKTHGVIGSKVRLRAGVPTDEGDRRIVVHVSPDNDGPGFIEHIILNEIKEHAFGPCIDAFSEAIEKIIGSRAHAKSLVSAYIGVREPGVCGTGYGFSRKILDVSHEAYRAIRDSFTHLL